MDELFSSLHKDFVEETLPIVDEVGRLSLKLEEVRDAGGDGKPLLRSIRSGLHTIKGNGAMMGLKAVEGAAHALEDVCSALSDAAASSPPGRPVGGRLVKLLIEGCDELAAMVRGSLDKAGGEVSDEALVARVGAAIAEADSREQGGERGPERASADQPSEPMHVHAEARQEGRDDGRSAVPMADVDIDGILQLAEETIVRQSELARVVGRLSRQQLGLGELALMDQLLSDLGRTSREIRHRLLKVRLAPIGTLFRRFVRYVRDLSLERGQPIELVMEGGDTAIDRAIISRLFEPLVHIVRNAVAHGIESPDERVAAGKPAKARIVFGARLSEGRVDVRIADDGRGLDLDAIAAKASAQGVDTSGLGEREVQRLIFQSGFSTAKTVSSLAGRGVGLDVVASVVQGLGGRIDVRSSTGRGTVFIMDLPVTLSLQKALLFGVDSEIFAIPTGFILDTQKSDERDVQEINRVLLLSWRGDFVRSVDGGRLLGCSGLAQDWTRPYAVVLQAGNKRGALLVDWLSGVQEIVVKPVDASLVGCHLVAGMTVVGQGRVVPILDCIEVVRRIGRAHVADKPATPRLEVNADVF